jgi:hypothetical protein
LSVYGWTKNPLVEYYIIESWGSWKPPGSASSKGTITTDGGTYDIFQNSRTGPSIEGNTTFQQFWSVRQSKHTSGIITCGNHFSAWESKGMRMGNLYEVSFVVEGYQSSGNADVTMSMNTGTGARSSSGGNSSTINVINAQGTSGRDHIRVMAGGTQTVTFMMPVNSYASLKVYNFLGQEIAGLAGREYSAGQHSVTFNASNYAKGIYYYAIKAGNR